MPLWLQYHSCCYCLIESQCLPPSTQGSHVWLEHLLEVLGIFASQFCHNAKQTIMTICIICWYGCCGSHACPAVRPTFHMIHRLLQIDANMDSESAHLSLTFDTIQFGWFAAVLRHARLSWSVSSYAIFSVSTFTVHRGRC